MFARSWKFGAALLFLFAAAQSRAATVTIDYSVSQVSGSTYEYIYSIFNDGSLPSGGPVQLFDIDFPTALYSNLVIETPSNLETQWYDQIFPGSGSVPSLYDVCATPSGDPTCPTTSGVTSGNTVSGFAVEFTYLGGGTPGSQAFTIYNASNPSQQLEVGQTSPEPSTICLGAFALALVGYLMRRGRLLPPPGIKENECL